MAAGIHLANGQAIEIISTGDPAPPASDAKPRLLLAFRLHDGRLVPIKDEAVSYAPFRNGVALVNPENRLVFVTPDGARRVLANESGAPPIRGPKGELVYVAKYRKGAEIHVLEAQGDNGVVAEGFANAGLLKLQPDGRLFFVAATNGGVAGLWTVDDIKAGSGRCLTNCDLRTGKPWGDAFVPAPGDAESIRVIGERVQWKTPEGLYRYASLTTRDSEACKRSDDQCGESENQRDRSDSRDEEVGLNPLGETP